MGYSIDGSNKVISITSVNEFDAQDLYSRWKEWVQTDDNAKWSQAMSTVGGDPVTDTETVAPYFFMENGWKIRPREANHTLLVTGNLLQAGGGTPFIATTGTYNVQVLQQFSANSIGVITGEGGGAPTAAQVAAAVWNRETSEHNQPGTFGELTQKTNALADDAVALSSL